MKIELSKEAIDIILAELEIASNQCLSNLVLLQQGSNTYKYYEQRQGNIKKALEELRRAI